MEGIEFDDDKKVDEELKKIWLDRDELFESEKPEEKKIETEIDFLEEEKDLLERVKWLIRMRWIAILAEVLLPFFLNNVVKLAPLLTGNIFPGGIDIPILPFLIIASVVTLQNLIYVWWTRNIEKRKILRFSGKELQIFANIQIALDLLIVTFIVHFTGGVASPLILIYFFHMVTSSTLLSRKESYFQATLTTVFFVTLALFEFFGLVGHWEIIKGLEKYALFKNPNYVLAITCVFPGTIYALVWLHSFLTKKLRVTQESLKAKAIELLAFYHTSKMISSTLEIDKVIEKVMGKFCKTYRINKYSFMLYDHYDKELYITGAKGLSLKVIENLRFKLGEGIPGRAIQQNEIITTKNSKVNEKEFYYKKFDPSAANFVCVPMKIKDRIIGTLSVHKDTTQQFSRMEMDLLSTIANNVAVTIMNNELYKRVKELSIKDGLTHLYNHRYFQERMDEEIARADRYNHALSLLMMDLDLFKIYNDKFGHLEGDQILKEISKILLKNIRQTDTLARYGGEEFVIIMPETKSRDALRLAERIRKRIESHVFGISDNGDERHLTISIGVATYPYDGKTKPEIIDNADKALYKAKNIGRNTIIAYQSLAS